MAENLDQTIETLLRGLEEHISTKTVMGEPVSSGGITIFPLADITFGMAAGAFNKEKGENGAGGVGARVSPTALLIIQNGTSRIVNIRDTDSINKILNMVPDIVNKISDTIGNRRGEEGKKKEV